MTERPEWFIRKLASCFLNRHKQTMEVATEAVCMIRAHLKVVPPTFTISPFLSIKVVLKNTQKKLTSVLFTLVSFTEVRGLSSTTYLNCQERFQFQHRFSSISTHCPRWKSFGLTLTDQCCPNLIIIMQITPSLCVWMLGEALRYREKLCMDGLL